LPLIAGMLVNVQGPSAAYYLCAVVAVALLAVGVGPLKSRD
jgi:hypothetical protein